MRSTRSNLLAFLLCLAIGLLMPGGLAAAGDSSRIEVTDSSGKTVCLKETPKRVVSLVPGVTETFFALGAGDLIAGLTYYDTYPRDTVSKTVVGGFLDPSADIIAEIQPDVILLSSLHAKIRQRFADCGIPLIQVDAPTMEDGFRMIELVGRIANKSEEAATKVSAIRKQLDLVAGKVAKIPEAKRKRVMRLMGSEAILTPGDGSFQNDLIRCAGGIPPSLGKPAAVVPVTLEEWRTFDPQLIYCCGNEWECLKKYVDKPGWKDVEAVKKSNYSVFPCELTCRPSVNMGYFAAWLASVLYPEEFADEKTRLGPDTVLNTRQLVIDLPYVKSAQVVEGTMLDFPTQTLLIDFTEAMGCLNSLAGDLSGIDTIGNHYLSPPLWATLHVLSMDDLKRNLCRTLGRNESGTSFLYTGARMDSLSVQKMQHRDMVVYALVTAGVAGNAIRASVDEGSFYEPGTINTMVLTNMQLSPRARTRAIISATEAKSAALQDLDIRSSYTPRYMATGTGTDEVLIVQGRGKKVENAGGHSKLGELIAKAVYRGVQESAALQNGLQTGRSVFRRLKERKIDLRALVTNCGKFSREEGASMCGNLERLLLDPAHAGLMEWAFALGDAHQRGLVRDLQPFQDKCKETGQAISGKRIDTWIRFVPEDLASQPICMAFDALMNGLYHKAGKVVHMPERFGTGGK